MTPYNIKLGDVSGAWIDLDHILAIYDPIVDQENISQYSRYAFFSILVAFRNDPIVVYSESYRQEHIDTLRKAHADLLTAWKDQRPSLKEALERTAELYALQTHIGVK